MQRIMFSLERGGNTINNGETLLPSSPKPHCVLNWENCSKSSISWKPTKQRLSPLVPQKDLFFSLNF